MTGWLRSGPPDCRSAAIRRCGARPAPQRGHRSGRAAPPANRAAEPRRSRGTPRSRLCRGQTGVARGRRTLCSPDGGAPRRRRSMPAKSSLPHRRPPNRRRPRRPACHAAPLPARLTPEGLSRTGITTVTSRWDGPLAGRGWATVASSKVRASCALGASCTSSRPLVEHRLGRRRQPQQSGRRTAQQSRALAEHLAPADPPGRRSRRAAAGRVIATSRRRRVPIARSARRQPRTISAKMRAPSSAVAVVGSPSTPTSLTAATPPRRMPGIRSASGAGLPGTGFLESAHHTAKDGAIQRFRYGPAWASPPGTAHGHQPTSRPS